MRKYETGGLFEMTRRKGSKDYPKWMKREALKLYLEEGWGAGEIRERFSIADRNRINAWVRQYRAEGEGMFEDKRRGSGRRPKKENTAAYIARLEMELDLLKKFHTELRQHSLAKRDIGSSKITGEDTRRKRCAPSSGSREPPTMPGAKGPPSQTRTFLA